MVVLLVDDEETMCRTLSRTLSRAGLAVRTANTVSEALSIADKYEISAAVLDFHLPDGTGLDLFLDLKKRYGVIPSVLISGSCPKEVRSEAYRLGFDACIDKPFDDNVLVTAVKKVLRSQAIQL